MCVHICSTGMVKYANFVYLNILWYLRSRSSKSKHIYCMGLGISVFGQGELVLGYRVFLWDIKFMGGLG